MNMEESTVDVAMRTPEEQGAQVELIYFLQRGTKCVLADVMVRHLATTLESLGATLHNT